MLDSVGVTGGGPSRSVVHLCLFFGRDIQMSDGGLLLGCHEKHVYFFCSLVRYARGGSKGTQTMVSLALVMMAQHL